MTVLTISTIPIVCSNHNIDPHHSQLTSKQMEDHNFLTKTNAILNIIKDGRFVRTHDCRAKHNYLDTIPNPKGKVGIQFKKCMQ
jgi:hypothetical protein